MDTDVYVIHILQRSSVPFSPNDKLPPEVLNDRDVGESKVGFELNKLPPEVLNDRDVGESKVGYELDLAKAPNNQQTGDQLANSTDNKTI